VTLAMALVARSNALTMATHHPDEEGDLTVHAMHIHKTVKRARDACFKLWPVNFRNPTQHGGSHQPDIYREIGGARLVKTGKGETKHRQVAFGLRGLNGRLTPEELIMREENLLSAALFLTHGGDVHLPPNKFGKGFLRVMRSDFIQSMLKTACSAKTYADEADASDDIMFSSTSASSSSDGKEDVSSDDEDPTAEVVPTTGDIARGPALNINTVVLDLASTEGLGAHHPSFSLGKAYSYIEPGYRPPYCRRIAINRYYTIADADALVASSRVGFVNHILEPVAGTFLVHLNWMEPVKENNSNKIDRLTTLSVIRHSDAFVVCPAERVLEPRHVVHLCNEDCGTTGAGFAGHGVQLKCDTNEYLDNEFFLY
jgi:hypothetical protein